MAMTHPKSVRSKFRSEEISSLAAEIHALSIKSITLSMKVEKTRRILMGMGDFFIERAMSMVMIV